jgi:putative DNA-invertase from lambdoid prophage Rac
MPMKAAIYARVSTKDQKTIPDQLAELRAYAERSRWRVMAEFSEIESGKRDTRPQRAKLMQLVTKKKIDVVMVYKLDRWGRSTIDVLTTLMELHSRGVAFVSITEGFDMTTPVGKLMAQMLAIFAEFERETIVARVRAGVDSYRAKHKRWGRPPTTKAKSKEVLRLWDEGKNKSQIEKLTGVSRATIRRLLARDGRI